MSKPMTTSFVAAILAASATLAGARELVTPLIDASFSDEYACNVVNTSPYPVSVEIEVIGTDGEGVVGPSTLTLPPRAADRVVYIEPNDGQGVYCRFSFPGSARKVRASLTVYDGTHDVVSAEAR